MGSGKTKVYYTHRCLRQEAPPPHPPPPCNAGPCGEALGWSEDRDRSREKNPATASTGVSSKREGGVGEQFGVG